MSPAFAKGRGQKVGKSSSLQKKVGVLDTFGLRGRHGSRNFHQGVQPKDRTKGGEGSWGGGGGIV